MKKYSESCHYISACAKLPEDFPSGEVYKYVDVGLVIDFDSMEIIDGSITLLTRCAQKFLFGKILGKTLTEEGVMEIETELKRTYHGSALKAIIVAVRHIHEKAKLIATD